MSDFDSDQEAIENLQIDHEKIKAKMDYISMQMDKLSETSKDMFASEFKTVTKTLKTLRNVLNNKMAPELKWYECNYYFVGCAMLLILLFG